jgi:hypothetical protein
MGWCKLPGSDEYEPGWSSEGCAAAGGVYSETDPNAKFCFVATILTRSYGLAILELGASYETASAFRDEVLASSPLGQHMVDAYYKYNPAILSVVMGDYPLMAEAMTAWKSILAFVTATVATARGEVAEFQELRYTKEQHAQVTAVLERLRAKSPDPSFNAFITEVNEEMARYVGMSPREALETCRRKPERGDATEE